MMALDVKINDFFSGRTEPVRATGPGISEVRKLVDFQNVKDENAMMNDKANDGGLQSSDNSEKIFPNIPQDRTVEAGKQLICGGMAGSIAKTLTAPLSRLTILFQVHSLVTTKKYAPKYADSVSEGALKIMKRGGVLSFWKGNGTSVLHRFPFSAINFFVYENMLDFLSGRVNSGERDKDNVTPFQRFTSGAVAGSVACVACYPLDLVRTRLTTELPGKEIYKGISDTFRKIVQREGPFALYSGIGPTLFVAVPNFAISYSVYGSLKEYVLDDDLFYNLRKVDSESGEHSLGLPLTLLCGAASGSMSAFITFPFDTIRRRMQIQSLHLSSEGKEIHKLHLSILFITTSLSGSNTTECLSGRQQFLKIINTEGMRGLYRGIQPELLKVVPFVGTMFVSYEYLKDKLNIKN